MREQGNVRIWYCENDNAYVVDYWPHGEQIYGGTGETLEEALRDLAEQLEQRDSREEVISDIRKHLDVCDELTPDPYPKWTLPVEDSREYLGVDIARSSSWEELPEGMKQSDNATIADSNRGTWWQRIKSALWNNND